MVTVMGDEERAGMYLELEKTVREIKELEWRLEQVERPIEQVSTLLKNREYGIALSVLGGKDFEQSFNLDRLRELLDKIVKLYARKVNLEKKLSVKISLE